MSGGSGFKFSRKSADSVFREFFGFDAAHSPSDATGNIFGSSAASGPSDSGSTAHGRRGAEKKAPAIERKLPCSLEELYHGTTKKMKISREIVDDASGRTSRQEEEILQIDVKPGWKKGTKITFTERGNKVAPDVIPADLVFLVDEKPHPVFTRDGNDLVVTQRVLLAEALTGYTVHLTAIDGRTLTVPISSIIHPRHEEVVRGEGMPFPKDPSRKGNLRVKFDIEFPTMLTANEKSAAARLLGLQRMNLKEGGHGDEKVVDNIFGSSAASGPSDSGRRRAEKKAPAIERKLPCSLEELYHGTTKTMKISREIVDDASGRTRQEEEVLQIDVKPGWKKGTKITFTERGNKVPDLIPADLVFLIDEKPHPVFTRDGNDLVVTQRVLLAEALTGYTVHLTAIDGRTLTVPISSIIHPRHEEVVRGEGMPLPKDPSRKGNLRVKFDIEFPAMLTANEKSAAARLLGLQRMNLKEEGHGDEKVADNCHAAKCQAALDVANLTVAATHGENSGQGRIVYVGSIPVRMD